MLLTIATLLVAIPFCAAGNTTHWSVGNIIIPDSTVRFRLDIYSPTTPGSYPVLVFLTGLSGLIPATFYKTLATTVTEEGVIIIGISKIENFKARKDGCSSDQFLGMGGKTERWCCSSFRWAKSGARSDTRRWASWFYVSFCGRPFDHSVSQYDMWSLDTASDDEPSRWFGSIRPCRWFYHPYGTFHETLLFASSLLSRSANTTTLSNSYSDHQCWLW